MTNCETFEKKNEILDDALYEHEDDLQSLNVVRRYYQKTPKQDLKKIDRNCRFLWLFHIVMDLCMNVLILAQTKTDTVLGRRYTTGIQRFSTDIMWDECPGGLIKNSS